MFRQNCPVCASGRIRRGYQHTPIWKKLFFRYYLLCDNCNLEYIGFALPPSWESKMTNRYRREKRKSASIAPAGEGAGSSDNSLNFNNSKIKVKKKVKQNRGF
jgi:hypothetical protein